MNRIRKAMAIELLEALNEGGLLEQLLKHEAEQAKESFFKGLTPIKESGYTQVFQAILKMHDDLTGSESKSIEGNWAHLFIEYHNEMIHMMKTNLNGAVMKVRGDFDKETIIGFYADTRNLDQLIEATAVCMQRAFMEIESEKDRLKEQLHTQLQDVAGTLKALTKENNSPKKQFEIVTEGAVFKIELNDDESEETCECEDLEQLIKSILG